jgi:hypothetical protein
MVKPACDATIAIYFIVPTVCLTANPKTTTSSACGRHCFFSYWIFFLLSLFLHCYTVLHTYIKQ